MAAQYGTCIDHACAVYFPIDDQVRFSIKRQTSWVGYKVHLTETCDDQLPRIITEVKTTLAPIADGDMTTPIHTAFQNNYASYGGGGLFNNGYADIRGSNFHANTAFPDQNGGRNFQSLPTVNP
jgi:hypothetical protein